MNDEETVDYQVIISEDQIDGLEALAEAFFPRDPIDFFLAAIVICRRLGITNEELNIVLNSHRFNLLPNEES